MQDKKILLLIASICVFHISYYFLFVLTNIVFAFLDLKSSFEISWALFEAYHILLCSFYILISFTLYIFIHKKKFFYLFYALPLTHIVCIIYTGKTYIRDVDYRIILLSSCVILSFFLTKIFVDFFFKKEYVSIHSKKLNCKEVVFISIIWIIIEIIVYNLI